MDWKVIADIVIMISALVSVFYLGRAYEIMQQMKKETKTWSKR
jgi:hypothetical protein